MKRWDRPGRPSRAISDGHGFHLDVSILIHRLQPSFSRPLFFQMETCNELGGIIESLHFLLLTEKIQLETGNLHKGQMDSLRDIRQLASS